MPKWRHYTSVPAESPLGHNPTLRLVRLEDVLSSSLAEQEAVRFIETLYPWQRLIVGALTREMRYTAILGGRRYGSSYLLETITHALTAAATSQEDAA